jgi:hypothetical protein
MMARALIAIAVLSGFVVLPAWVAQPGFMQSMFGVPLWPVGLPAVGVAIYFFGLGWMVRLYPRDPEPDRPSWRYRDF